MLLRSTRTQVGQLASIVALIMILLHNPGLISFLYDREEYTNEL